MGRGGVFVTPTKVELSKTGHACCATSTYEYTSSKYLRNVPFLEAEPDSPHFLVGVARTQPPPVLPFPHHYVCTNPKSAMHSFT